MVLNRHSPHELLAGNYKSQDEMWKDWHPLENILTRTQKKLHRLLNSYKLLTKSEDFYFFLHHNEEDLLALKIDYRLRDVDGNYWTASDEARERLTDYISMNQHLEQYNVYFQYLYVKNAEEPELEIEKRSQKLVKPVPTSERKLKAFLKKYPWVKSQPDFPKLERTILYKNWYRIAPPVKLFDRTYYK